MAVKPSALIDIRVIYCGDNLDRPRKFPAARVDLICINPPFNPNRNYKVLVRRVRMEIKFITIFTALFLVVGCSRPTATPKFKGDLDKLISEGSRLNALTQQGATNEKFGDQLANVVAAYDVALSDWSAWRQDPFPGAKVGFERAIHGWRLAYQIWNRQIRYSAVYSSDEMRNETDYRPLIDAAEEYTNHQIPPIADRDGVWISYRQAIRTILAEASSHFEVARALSTTQH